MGRPDALPHHHPHLTARVAASMTTSDGLGGGSQA